MTIALRSTVQATDTDTSTHSAITGLTAGDVFIDIAHNTGGGAAPTLPGGSYPFTTISTGWDSGGRNYTYGSRVATGAETGLVTTGFKLADTFFACSGVDNTTPIESFQAPGSLAGTTVTVAASTPTADNCWHVLIFATTNTAGKTISTPPSGYTQLSYIPVSGQGTVYVYYKDLGAGSSGVSTGTKDAIWSAGGGFGMGAGFILRAAGGGGGPTVTSVTQTSGGTEGSPAVMTVALSGATSGSTNFAATLAGVTATGSGTDFTSDLASATYSNGVTFSGGNMVVPDAVSGWTVTIATTSDTLDEANETATLTVGGTAGTLTITDDDAAPTITGTASSTVTAGSPVVITYSPGLSGQTRTYTLALTDGTAVGGTDYDNTTVTGDFAVTAGTGSVLFSGSTVTVDAGVTEFTLTITTTA